MVAFESIARSLLFLHLVAAACATGAAIHLAVRIVRYLQGRPIKIPHEKLYARLLAISYAVTYGLGAMIYPAFRIRVRHEYFDRQVPAATGLFEVKEHLATLGLVVVIGIWLVSRDLPFPTSASGRRLLPFYAGLVGLTLAILTYNVWSGWYLSLLKGL